MPLEPAKGRRFHWRHFADDRLPIATTIIFYSRRDYYDLQEGQWMRLAFVDPPGKDPYPYEPAFLKKTFDHHCYDRYHFEENEATEDAPTRYLMSDYALTAVTYRKEDRTGKDNSFADDIAMHMQRHYYQLFLLGVVDKAVMLMLSSQISAAVEAFDVSVAHGELPGCRSQRGPSGRDLCQDGPPQHFLRAHRDPLHARLLERIGHRGHFYSTR